MRPTKTQRQGACRQSLWRKAALCAIALACALMFAHGAAASHESRVAFAAEGVKAQASAASKVAYAGDTVQFATSDLKTKFGMFGNDANDMKLKWSSGKVRISFTPNNKTVYAGFYIDASIGDVPANATYPVKGFPEGSWIGKTSGGAFDFELDGSYCGFAWPVTPIKGADRGGGTTAGQYYIAIPAAEKIPGYTAKVTVVFTDGNGTELARQELTPGEDATPPADPSREGFVFDGWDKDYTRIAKGTTINAQWLEEGKTYYTVTFEDGAGGVVKRSKVEEGAAATAPDAPEREGYTFSGWKPDSFGKVTADLTVVAQWVSDDEQALAAMRTALAALPSDPKSLANDFSNAKLAAAATAYNALSAELKAQLTDDERLHLAKCAIMALPSDAYDITADHKQAVYQAQDIYESLPANLQGTLDSTNASSSRSYGRYLENGVWGFDSLRKVNNVTLLKEGTYAGQVKSSSSMGKSPSRRSLTFTVTSITVKGGYATAVVEHSSNASQSLRMGGVEYQNLQGDPAGHSYFEIPINLNSTFHFAIKGKDATDDTDAITYEMTVSADEGAMTPDSPKAAEPDGDAKAAKAVADQISLLPSKRAIAAADASKLVAYRASIQLARKAYDALTDAQKALVGSATVKKLEDAEAALAKAEKARDGSSGDTGDSGSSGGTSTPSTPSAPSAPSNPSNPSNPSAPSSPSSPDGAESNGKPDVATSPTALAPTRSASSFPALTAKGQKPTATPSGPVSNVASDGERAKATLEQPDSATAGSPKGSDAQELAVESPTEPSSAAGADLGPAIAGALVLLVALGFLMFTLRFARRESLAG